MKQDHYRTLLATLPVGEWDAFLLAESGLPGPRGNLELAQAVADAGNEALFRRLAGFGPEVAPVNSPQEFLAFCGVLGLGRLLAEGRGDVLEELCRFASDPRWRTREAVAMALQRWGEHDMGALLDAMETWALGRLLERRAAVAALCEPTLLRKPEHVLRVLGLLDRITASLLKEPDRKSLAFLALRKGLGYCWSVPVAALPGAGRAMMEKWLACPDRDVAWIMRENLRKNRLRRVAPEWVARWCAQTGQAPSG